MIFAEEDLYLWPHRDFYLLQLLNGAYDIADARDDLKSLVDRRDDDDKELNNGRD
jgi:hypothetical protein